MYLGSGALYMLKDERGSIVAYTSENTGDTNGTVQRVNLYDPYGRIDGDDHVGVFSYTGQQYIPEIDLHHYKARYYHADIGRFLQTDPIGYEGGMNLYAYAFNDPVNLTDPNGEMPASVFWRIDRLWSFGRRRLR